jgi:hypothetical protein
MSDDGHESMDEVGQEEDDKMGEMDEKVDEERATMEKAMRQALLKTTLEIGENTDANGNSELPEFHLF